jgi:hypothetical protein
MGEAGVDLTGRLMADMDPGLLEFLQMKVNTFVKWDLARFFSDNPNTADTSENIARYAGRSVETIREDLIEMARDGVLEDRRVGDLVVYSLSSDTKVRGLLSQLGAASQDRQFRVKAIYHIIRGMRR